MNNREQLYYDEVRKALMYNGANEQQAITFMNNYHLRERLEKDYLFMAHYDPRDIADEIMQKESKAYA